MPRLSTHELEEIGTTQTHLNNDEACRAYRARLEKRFLSPLQIKTHRADDNYNPRAVQRSAKQKMILENRFFPNIFLTRYLVMPLWDTFSELWMKKRIFTNSVKIILSLLIIASIITTLIYFPPLIAVFAAINIPASVTIVGGGTLALFLGNWVVNVVDSQAHQRHWDAYECSLLQEKFWKSEYGIEPEMSQKIKAYLFNQYQHSDNKILKEITQKLLNQLEIGSEEEINDIAVFFIKELAILEKKAKPLKDYQWVLEIVSALNNAKNLPLPTKVRLSNAIGRLAIDQWRSKVDAQFNNLNDLIKRTPSDTQAIYECYEHVQEALEHLEINMKNEKINLVLDSKAVQKASFNINKDYGALNNYLSHLNEKREAINQLKAETPLSPPSEKLKRLDRCLKKRMM